MSAVEAPKYAAGAAGHGVPLTPETGTPPRVYSHTALDVVYACVWLLLGWLFWELQVWQNAPWRSSLANVAAFTVLYAAAVLSYVFLSGIVPPRESWFWMAVLLCLGFSCLLPWAWDLLGGVVQYGALLLVASYWTLAAGGRLYRGGRTSNWIAFDLFHVLLAAPWGNFGRLCAVLWGAWRAWAQKRREARAGQTKSARGRHAAAVAGGVAGAALCLCAVLPPLMAADTGFASLFTGLLDAVHRVWSGSFQDIGVFLFKLLFALPTAFYLYGLAYGAVKGRCTALFERREICAAQARARRLPKVTVATVLGVLAGVYLLFIAMQARYLFGAFLGMLPEGFTYAGYARQGFFELCRVAAVNAVILSCASIFSRWQKAEWRALRVLNGALAALTLLLLATAAAKMAMYMGVYGLTEKRILASTALVWQVFVFTCVLLRQCPGKRLRALPLVRAAVCAGAVLFTVLCLAPVPELVGRWNETHAPAAQAAQGETPGSEMRSADDGETHRILWQGRSYALVGTVSVGGGRSGNRDVPKGAALWNPAAFEKAGETFHRPQNFILRAEIC